MQVPKTKRRTFDSEFKRQAVRLVIEDGKNCRTVERDLGLSEGTVYKWVQNAREDPENCFPGKGHVRASDAEVHRDNGRGPRVWVAFSAIGQSLDTFTAPDGLCR